MGTGKEQMKSSDPFAALQAWNEKQIQTLSAAALHEGTSHISFDFIEKNSLKPPALPQNTDIMPILHCWSLRYRKQTLRHSWGEGRDGGLSRAVAAVPREPMASCPQGQPASGAAVPALHRLTGGGGGAAPPPPPPRHSGQKTGFAPAGTCGRATVPWTGGPPRPRRRPRPHRRRRHAAGAPLHPRSPAGSSVARGRGWGWGWGGGPGSRDGQPPAPVLRRATSELARGVGGRDAPSAPARRGGLPAPLRGPAGMLPTHPRRSRRPPRRHRPPVPRAAPYPRWQRRGPSPPRAAAGTRGQMQPLFCVAAWAPHTETAGGPGKLRARIPPTAREPAWRIARPQPRLRGAGLVGRRGAARSAPASPQHRLSPLAPARCPHCSVVPGPARQPLCPEARASLSAHGVLLGPAPGEVSGGNAEVRELPHRGPVGWCRLWTPSSFSQNGTKSGCLGDADYPVKYALPQMLEAGAQLCTSFTRAHGELAQTWTLRRACCSCIPGLQDGATLQPGCPSAAPRAAAAAVGRYACWGPSALLRGMAGPPHTGSLYS